MKILTYIVIILVVLVAITAFLSWNRNPISTAGWQTAAQNGMSFEYPPNLGTTYVHLVNWPPTLQVANTAFSCSSGQEMIYGHTYCVTKSSEGAAGSTYTTYNFAFPFNNQTASLNFVAQFPQCPNYGDTTNPNRIACSQEESSFSVDPVIDRIARSIK